MVQTVALVTRKRVSCVTDSTSGELFMIVLTRANGKFDPPLDDVDIFSDFLAITIPIII